MPITSSTLTFIGIHHHQVNVCFPILKQLTRVRILIVFRHIFDRQIPLFGRLVTDYVQFAVQWIRRNQQAWPADAGVETGVRFSSPDKIVWRKRKVGQRAGQSNGFSFRYSDDVTSFVASLGSFTTASGGEENVDSNWNIYTMEI